MPEANAGPAGSESVTPDPSSEEILPGFSDAMIGFGNPMEPHGEPAARSAVETSEATPPPTPAAVKEETPPAKDEVKQEASKAPNFDGFSKEQKATWERLYKAGLVDGEEVERARKESLFQQSWTESNMKKSAEVDAANARAAEAEAWKAKNEERLTRLERVLSSDKRLQAFESASAEDFSEDPEEKNRPITREEAVRISDERDAARQKERDARTAKEQRDYKTREATLRKAVSEEMRLMGVDQTVMKSYLDAVSAKLPTDVDPVTHFKPDELRQKLSDHHELVSLKGEVERLKQQLTGKSSASENRSKQSLAPSRRVSESSAPKGDAWAETLAELNVDGDMSNVQGLGGWGNGKAP